MAKPSSPVADYFDLREFDHQASSKPRGVTAWIDVLSSKNTEKGKTTSPNASSTALPKGTKPPVRASSSSPGYHNGRKRVSSEATCGHTPSSSRYGAGQAVTGSPSPIHITDEESEVLLEALKQSNEKYASSLHLLEGDDRTNQNQSLVVRTDSEHSPFAGPSKIHSPSQESSLYTSALLQMLSVQEGAAMLSDRLSQTRKAAGPKRRAQSVPTRPAHTLYEDAVRVKLEKQQWASLEKARQELLETARIQRDCPFRPTLSPYAAKMKRPASLRPENRTHAELIRKKQWRAMKAQEEVEKELAPCTFRPLTLRAVRLEADSLAITNDVYDNLYSEATERQHFQLVVRPQLTEQMDKLVRQRGTAKEMTEEEKQEVVNRLFSRAAVIAAKKEAKREEEAQRPRQPSVSKKSREIVKEKVLLGERNPNIVQHLYVDAQVEHEHDLAQKELDEKIAKKQQRIGQEMVRMEQEKAKERLEMDRQRCILVAKFHAISKKICALQGGLYVPGRSQPVVGLARAALDVLSPEEAEELLCVLERFDEGDINEAEFVQNILMYVREQKQKNPQYVSPLFTRVPPQEKVHDLKPKPKELPIIKRERPDKEAIEKAKAKREARIAEWKDEARQRRDADGAEGELPAEYTFKPAPRRLIPEACRPDAQVQIRPTRAYELRRAHVAAHQQQEADSPEPVAPLREVEVVPVPVRTARSLFNTPPPRSVASTQPSSQDGNACPEPFCRTEELPKGTTSAVNPSPSQPQSQPSGSAAATSSQKDDAPSAEPSVGARGSVSTRTSATASTRAASEEQKYSTALCRQLLARQASTNLQDLNKVGRELLLCQLREHQRRRMQQPQ